MTFSAIVIKSVAAAAALAAVGALTPSTASADATVRPFGSTEQLVSAGGAEIMNYTVTNLQPSGRNDGVWQADFTVKSVKGPATPIVGDFFARAADGSTYPIIEGSHPFGLSNQAVVPGDQSTGRLYFGVTGTQPDSIVYNGGTDELIWKG